MKVAIDLLPITGQNAGFETYAKQLVASLATKDQEFEYLLIVNARTEHLFDISEPNFKILIVQTPPNRFVNYWEQMYLPIMRELRKVDLLHSPVSALPIYVPCNTITTIHDLTFIYFPETMKLWSLLYWRYFSMLGAKRANKIIVPSKSTALSLQKEISISENKIAIVGECCSDIYYQNFTMNDIESTKKRYMVTGKYILTVGTLEPRKNITTILEALSLIKNDIAMQLVIVGKCGWLEQSIFEKIETLGLQNNVILTGFVPEKDLPKLYQGAEVFVYPSLYEGFGLPPLEAMASGIPVVASNSSSIPEVVGDAGILIEPLDVKGFANAIVRLCTDFDYHNELCIKGQQQARRFTINEMGIKTRRVYSQVINEVR